MTTGKIKYPTDEEEAAIQAGIAADPDSPEWTEDDWAKAIWVKDMTPDQLTTMIPPEAAEAELRRRGKQKAPVKDLTSIRLDKDLVEHLRATGKGWQNRANEMLRKAVGI